MRDVIGIKIGNC